LLPLKEVAEFSKKLVTSKSDDLIFLGLENIESNTGIFVPSEEKKKSFGTALTFEKGDVLFPKLRPYLNKVYLAEFDGVCSTEFYVLKAKKCDRMYLFWFLNSQLVVNQTSYLMTGNTLPRLQTEEVENLLIPLPPIQIQNKIIEQMKQIKEARKLKETEAQQLLDSINDYVLDELGIKLPELEDKMVYIVNYNEVKGKRIDAYYYQPKFEKVEKFLKGGKYEIEQLGKFIVDLKMGCSLPPDKRGVPEVPYILGKNLRHGYLDLSELEYISNVNNEKFKSSIVHENDILFSVRGAYIGKVAVVEKEIAGANIINNIVKITLSNKLNPRFVSAFLNSEIEQQLIYRDVWGGAQPGFTNENIKSLKIPLPPLSVQDKIAEEVKSRMQKAEQLQKEAKELLENAKEEIEKLILGE